MKKYLSVFFIIMFMGGIALGIFGRVICTRSNQNYADLQPESFIPDVIETVLHDEELKQIYVCYNDANYVNVYDESGKFLWAVATPYIRNSYFDLQEGRLIICGGDDAYIYNSADGKFLGTEKEEDLNLKYDWENEQTGEFKDGEFYFDSYSVCKADSNGELHPVVSRPWWHRIFSFGASLCIAFAGALGIGITVFVEKLKAYCNVKKKVKLESRKAKVIINYFKVTSIIQLLYAFLDISFIFLGGIFCIIIIPIAVHFIVSNWILWNMLDFTAMNKEERAVTDFWKVFEIATFIIAFVSDIIVAVIAG